MIIIKISDGLGNQFFQYALGKSIAMKKNTSLKLDVSLMTNNNLRDYQLDKYNIHNDKFTIFEKIYFICFYKIVRKILQQFNLQNKFFTNIYWEKMQHSFDKNVFVSNSEYFFGYWQDLRYFKDIRETIVKDLAIKLDMSTKNKEVLRDIKKTNSISVHIRRGDYLKIAHQQVCDLEYYKKAVEIMKDKVNSPVFFVFSDDIEWVKKNLDFGLETHYVDFNQDTPEFDLELMKHCKHNIIANSTFSWWGAWLNEYNQKLVILPKLWRKEFPTPDALIEENWIIV